MVIDFKERIEQVSSELLFFDKLETLQVNLGNVCNQSCQHCHVEAGPAGNHAMSKEVMKKIISFLHNHPGITIDITGGCPELCPDFKFLVEEVRQYASLVMVRTNLTVLLEEGKDWIPRWYRDNGIIVNASMPCYTKNNVDMQRGEGVFEKCLNSLRTLNDLGYGESLELNLVYNPLGAYLPGSQKELEKAYKEELFQHYGLRFNKLFIIANAPIGRFKKYLETNRELNKYISLLSDNFNRNVVNNIMCRTLISIDWQGILYNCDFNQALGLPIRNAPGHVVDINGIEDLIEKGFKIVMAEHCYACTAGTGSSCTGTLA